VLIDDQPTLGGSLNYARPDAERERLLARLVGLPNVTVLTNAVCEGLFADNWLSVVRGRRLYKLRAQRVVLATGALEQPAIFRGNDLPGVMLGSAAQRLIHLYGVRPGSRAVVLAANDDGYAVALDLAEAGVEVAALIDLRGDPPLTPASDAVRSSRVRIATGHAIREATGGQRVRAVDVAPIAPDGSCGPVSDTIACDLVCVSVGYAPNLALAAHAGARLVHDSETAMQRTIDLPKTVTIAGAANQCFALPAVLSDGARAGTGSAANLARDPSAHTITHPYPIFRHPGGKEFVDFDEDLTIDDIEDAIASGFDDIQLLKRYSTAGMGPSQGRHSSVNTIRIAAKALGVSERDIGTTTLRPPYTGESFGALAGRGFEPTRRTAMHHRHLEAGAQMMVAGAWLRPAHYGGAAADAAAAIAGEVSAVRTGAGLIDVSTLGKIDLRGPDAAEFLNRLYVTAHLKQPVGRARYCLMTDMAGAVVDDGVACRLAESHFFVTATTSGVDAVVRSMYLWNAQWQMDVDIANTTAAYAAVNLAGPGSRNILTKLCRDVDCGADAFPYMGVRTGHVAGIPARLLRVGFVGELGYEIHVPAGRGEALWDALMRASAGGAVRPFGVEAQRVLRLEKAHIIIGQDTDGLTNPLELGMPIASKSFFVGAAAIAAHRDGGIGRRLAGFQLVDDRASVPKECHLVIDGGDIAGRVTSCVRSPSLGRVIGLAYLPPQRADVGQTFTIRVDRGELVAARVVPLPFYDPENERQKS
jgi:sarcosine oxidase subunit alpha